MVCCLNDADDKKSEEAFKKGGDNDLSEGLPTTRSCTDVFCIPIWAFWQLIFLLVTLLGAADGDPTKLYKPRDFMGAYCGMEENWNGGPKTMDQTFQSYTMNLTAIVNPAMKQTICSSLARTVLVDGNNGTAPLLTTRAEQDEYLCHCCLIPCEPCTGTLQVGGDLVSAEDLKDVITTRMSDLTDVSKADDLFDPAGSNGDMFSSQGMWSKATEFVYKVCVEDCSADYNSVGRNASTDPGREPRTHIYKPDMDSKFFSVWDKVVRAEPEDVAGQALVGVVKDAFSFKALPFVVCPYPTVYCVPMPGMEYEQLFESSNRCVFKLGKEVAAAVGSKVADAMGGIAMSSFSSAATESFGDMVGAWKASLDTFVLTSVLGFVIGLAFLVILRFFIGICVWLAIFVTTFIFAFGGGVLFVASGQCKGAGLFDTGRQNAAAVYVAGSQAARDAYNGREPADESMSGDGADYRGVQYRSISGRLCLPWDEQEGFPRYNSTYFPELAESYCRNPYEPGDRSKAKTIWCIIGQPDLLWEECLPVGVIQPVCREGYAVEGETSRKALKVSSVILWVVAFLWIILVCCMHSRIQLAIALNKVAADFLGSKPQTLLVPIVQGILAFLWCLSWCLSASFLISQVPEDHTPKEYFATFAEAYGVGPSCDPWEEDDCNGEGVPGKCTGSWPTGGVWKDAACDDSGDDVLCWRCSQPRYMFDHRFAASFFVFLWNNAALVALAQITIAACVGIWFFSKTRGSEPVLRKGVAMVLRYHLGSVLFGSFIVAVVQFIRYCLYYLQKQAEAQKNRAMAIVLRCLQCCLWCFEKCIKFLNKNAYIQIVLTGRNFCSSAKTAFQLILRNILRFGFIAMLGKVVHVIGFFFIASTTVILGCLSLRAMHPEVSPFVPIVCYIAIGYIVAELYLSVFSMAVDTALQCFIVCEEMDHCLDEIVPDALKNFVVTVNRHSSVQKSQSARKSSVTEQE